MPALKTDIQSSATNAQNGDDIVISGMSGRFPECDNIEELKEALLAGVDLVTDDDRRWPKGLYGLPERSGKLKDIKHFDAQFFGVHAQQAHVMDPQLRLLLETTYETIVDSGYNPCELRGTRTAVIIGATASDSNDYWCWEAERCNGYGTLGGCRSMFSNRISFTFDFKGPSYCLDTGCSSSLYALQQAFEAIRSGQCEAAIVGGINMPLKPTGSLQLHKLNVLSKNGMCRSFDSYGEGYVRAEAIATFLLQKASAARRVYATIVNAGTNVDGNKKEGITYPSGKMQKTLMEQVYRESGINPHDVSYIETHGTGTKVGDPEEVNSVADFFCVNRNTPLLIGSVKSNMGHTEAAAGICAMTKVLVSMEEGVIPGNLHYDEPNKDILGLFDGRLQVVDKNTPWKGGVASVNSFGFGGTNAHVILRSNPVEKYTARHASTSKSIPRLITVSGRTDEAVRTITDKIENAQRDEEFLALLADIYRKNITGHTYRGYTLFGEGTSLTEIDHNNGDKRPIWWIYSGMGSQWPGLAKSLYSLDAFRNSINKSAETLKTYGVDLVDVVCNSTDKTFEDATNAYIAIVSVQIALTDTLTSFGIQPDGIIGHSFGEMSCGYGDGAFTAEQTILSAYWRGRCITDSNTKPARMAAIGLSWEETQKLAPQEIVVACHNSSESTTISGPIDAVAKFVADLTSQNIIAREIQTAGIASHSKYIAEAAPMFKASLDKIIPNPKPRSSRWISSSIPEEQWGEPPARLCSSEYHVNNFLNPVLFAEALKKVPENAIVIEIAPDALIQPILRVSLGPNVTSISLSKRNNPDNLLFFLSSIGKLYNAGLQPDLSSLVKPVQYPVSRGTQGIASLVRWDHSQEWEVPDFARKSEASGGSAVNLDLRNEKDAYLLGHTIHGNVLFPASGHINLVWQVFAKLQGKAPEELPVTLTNVEFHSETVLPKEGPFKFLINILEKTGYFEVCEEGSLVASGRIAVLEDPAKSWLNLPASRVSEDKDTLPLKTEDVYKELRLRGYDYNGVFCSISLSDSFSIAGKLKWANNWISFMDSMIQFSILGMPTREFCLPGSIRRINIDPLRQMEAISKLSKNSADLSVSMYRDVNVVQAGGVEIRGLKTRYTPCPITQQYPNVERYVFVPYFGDESASGEGDERRLAVIQPFLQNIIENSKNAIKLKAVEVEGKGGRDTLLAPFVIRVFKAEPNVVVGVGLASTSTEPLPKHLTDLGVKLINAENPGSFEAPAGTYFVLTTDLSSRADSAIWLKISESLKPGGFVLAEELGYVEINVPADSGLIIIGKQWADKYSYTLLRKNESRPQQQVIKVTYKEFSWVEPLKKALKENKVKGDRIILFSQGEEYSGLVGLMNCLMREPGGANLRSYVIQDPNAPGFSLAEPIYANQLNLDLVSNVLRNASTNQWGSYRNIYITKTYDSATCQVDYAYVNTLSHGDLNSLRWIEGPAAFLKPENHPGKELISVYYASLDIRDILLATGKLTSDELPRNIPCLDGKLGVEYSGRDSRGRRVMGIVPARGLATHVLADSSFLWEVPDEWTLEQAATVPVSYAISYALVLRGGISPGETILIHDGATDIGQAAIAISLQAGCTVYTTVNSQEKRNFVKKSFPQLTDGHIADSRDDTFEQHILQATSGCGVDRCLAKAGCSLDLSGGSLGAGGYEHTAINYKIHFEALFEITGIEKAYIVNLVSEGIKNGAVRPLPTNVYDETNVEQAFRFMDVGEHIGKVLLQVRKDDGARIVNAAAKQVFAVPRTYMNANKTYVLVGGLGGFGLELAYWLVSRGATKIVLTSRSGVKTGYQALCIRRLRQAGVKVLISTTEATTEKGAQQLLKESNQLGPVGGIFNLAVVLLGAFMENQTARDFRAVAAPKVAGTINLDRASRILCPELDYFVPFSSTSCGRGCAGEANYAFANSVMERLCEVRQAAGLPAICFQWGPVGDVGVFVETIGDNDTVTNDCVPQRMASCLRVLDIHFQHTDPVLVSFVLADKDRASGIYSGVKIVDAVAKIFGIKDMKTVMTHQSLVDMGMDSIMASGIRQLLERIYSISLSIEEIRELTFDKLMAMSQEDAAERL